MRTREPATRGTALTTTLEQGFGLVLDVGPQRRKRIRRLKQGGGKLSRSVAAVMAEAREKFDLAEDVEIVPVVILYRLEHEPALPPPPSAKGDV